MNIIGEAISATYEELRGERLQSWDWRQAESYRYTLPERGIPYINQSLGSNSQTDLEQARRLQGSIFDTTVLDSANTLARSLYQGATPPHSQWFDLSLPGITLEQLTESEKQSFDTDARILHSMIHSGNYNSTAMEFFLDYVIGGMVAINIELNAQKELYFEYIPMFSIMVQETLKKGTIDTAYRLLNMSLTQAAAEFGIDKLTDEQREEIAESAAEGKRCSHSVDYIHCVRPRIDDNGRQVPYITDPIQRIDNERWESIYVDKSTGEIVREGGFNEFPFIIPRWRRIPESPYGLGPVNDTMPDVKSLNKLVQQMFRANEIAISPPLKVKNDGVINPRTAGIGPNSIIKMQDTANMVPLITGTRYDVSMGEINRMQVNIRRTLLSNELDPITKANPTAYETDKYYEIMRERLGPAYNVMHDQLVQPLIQRCYALLYRAGVIGKQLPDRIQAFVDAGNVPTPEFKSPLARAGRIEDIKSLDRVVASLAGQREMFPNITDNFDADKALRFYSDAIGAPATALRSIAAVKQLRAKKQEAQEQAQQQAQEQAQAEQAQKAR